MSHPTLHFDDPATPSEPQRRRQPVEPGRLADEAMQLDYDDWVLIHSGKGDLVLSQDGTDMTMVEYARASQQERENLRLRAVPLVELVRQDAFNRMSPEQQREEIESFFVEMQLSGEEVFKKALDQPRNRLGLPPVALRPGLEANQAEPIHARVTGRTQSLLLFVDANNKEGTLRRDDIDPRSKENIEQLRIGDTIGIDFKGGAKASVIIKQAQSQRAGVAHIKDLREASTPPRANAPRLGM